MMSGACVQKGEHKDDTPRPIYGRMVAAKQVEAQVVLEITPLKLEELFEGIDVTFKWSPPNRDPLKPALTRRQALERRLEEDKATRLRLEEDKVTPASGRKLLFLSGIGNTFGEVVNAVTTVTNNVVTGVVNIATNVADQTVAAWNTVQAPYALVVI